MTVVNSNAPPEKSEARNAVAAISGFEVTSESSSINYGASPNSLQVIGERMDNFHRLEQMFSAAGWNLYPLHDESCLVVHRAWQISTVCHNIGQARAFLRRVQEGV